MHAETSFPASVASPQSLAWRGDREAEVRSPRRPRNISRIEQYGSLAAGAGLAAAAISAPRGSRLLLLLSGGALLHRGLTGHCYGYEWLGINTAERPPATAVPAQSGVKYETTIAILREPQALYQFWRRLENLPQVMRHLERVESQGDGRSHWVAQGALGRSVEWDAEIIEDRENEMLSWRSLPGSELETAGSVHFRPLGADRGTLLRVSLKYNPPGGQVGAWAARLFGEGAESQLDEDLRRFKSVMEAGEAPTVEGQPRGAH